MTDLRTSLFRPARRFLRSTDLTRDFRDLTALDGYFLTEFTKQCVERIGDGVKSTSSARAWRLTGDYGSGKSSFALMLAAALSDYNRLPKRIQQELGATAPHIRQAKYVPVLVTGTRESLSSAILRALLDLHREQFQKGATSALEEKLLKCYRSDSVADRVVVDLVAEVTGKLIQQNKGRGLVLILDEVGKFLEFAAMNPDKQDIFLLQKLGEAAARSGNEPFLLVCLLHQGFNAYADSLTISTKREWEKIAGRLEEIQFQHPLDQIVVLLSAALNTDRNKVDKRQVASLQASMKTAIRLGWYGASSSHTNLLESAAGLFPLDPFVIPVLVRTFQRYGQNERSIFSFLFSYESLGLHAFVSGDAEDIRPYRLHHFYDYVRANLGQRLAVASYRSHWTVIESVIDSFPTKDELEIRVMKTVGVLNLLNTDEVLPTEEAVVWAVAGRDESGHELVAKALKRLRSAKLLFFRGETRGYCLWPHSSVDIEARYEEAKREIPSVGSWAKSISALLDTRPVVARRHYIETGNLRFLRVVYCSVAELAERAAEEPADADGVILVPLCENEHEHREAMATAPAASHYGGNDFIRLVAITRPLNKLSGVILDSMRWDWVVTNTPELNNDRYAREEVSRFRTDATNRLERSVQDYVGLNRTSGPLQLKWFCRREPQRLDSGRQLLGFISDRCDEAFSKAPLIQNELVNRRMLSAAAAGARMRLIELMFVNSAAPMLGIPAGKNPPEKSMYLSVLQQTGLHWKRSDGQWTLGEPVGEDRCKVKAAIAEIRTFLEKHADSRVSVDALMQHLRRPPFGLRDGIIPIFIALVAIADKKDVAVYENGTFLRDVGKDAFLRLSKNPERFDIQYCKIEGLRAELFQQLVALLKLGDGKRTESELLDVVRELCRTIANLPEHTRHTKKLSKRAIAARTAILGAQEPIRLIFHDLPEACGFSSFGPMTAVPLREAQSFANVLKETVEEIRGAFSNLETRILHALGQQFDYAGQSTDQMRRELAQRATRVAQSATELRLKAFSMRLEDDGLSQSQWLESVGSVLALRPPSKWKDEDEETFLRELAALAGQFKRAEAVLFSVTGRNKSSRAIRVALTQADGSERHEVLFVSKDQEAALSEVQKEIGKLVGKHGRIGIAAASQVIWNELKDLSG